MTLTRFFNQKAQDFCLSVVDVRAAECSAYDEDGLAPGTLMRRAGRAALELIKCRYADMQTLWICCGSGNNGGDGYVLAGLAADAGYAVVLLEVGSRKTTSSEALAAREFALQRALRVEAHLPAEFDNKTLIVDALLGIGFRGTLRAEMQQVCAAINSCHAAVLALDVPSGVNADSGYVCADAVNADCTLEFIAAKRGLLTGPARDCVGDRYTDSLGIDLSRGDYQKIPLLDSSLMASVVVPRSMASHKGNYGHLLVIGGDQGMGGAAILAAQAALVTGCGKVSLATRACHVSATLTRVPEVMVSAVEHYNQILPLLSRADAIVIGPGLGRGSWGQQMLLAAISAAKPLLLDADALALIPAMDFDSSGWCITPHPGEAASLLGIAAADVEKDRFAAAQALVAKIPSTLVLKGSGSLLQNESGELAICAAGNPGTARAGMGDVLSGLIGGMMARGIPTYDAAKAGVWLHAAAADELVNTTGENALLPTTLLVFLPAFLADLGQTACGDSCG